MNWDPNASVELLVRCVDPAIEPNDEARIRSLVADGPDWDRVLELAGTHGVRPALNRRLDARFEDAVPAAVCSRLADRTRSIAMRNTRLARELHLVADAFEDAGIRWLPFKGPVLAAAAYGDLSGREFADVDLLVHPADASRAVDRLEARGYEFENDFPRRDDSALLGGPFTAGLVPEYSLCRSGVELEVRSSVGDPERPFYPAFETLWSRRTAVDVAGRQVPALSPADRLLVLAFHGTKHVWHLLKWICDFGTAVASAPVDWSRVRERARQHGTERALRLGLSLAEALFDLDETRDARDGFRTDPRVSALTRQVLADLEEGVPTRPSKWERTAFNAKASQSLVDSLPLVLGAADLRPSTLEYRLLPLPGALHPLYYLVCLPRALGVSCVQAARTLGE